MQRPHWISLLRAAIILNFAIIGACSSHTGGSDTNGIDEGSLGGAGAAGASGATSSGPAGSTGSNSSAGAKSATGGNPASGSGGGPGGAIGSGGARAGNGGDTAGRSGGSGTSGGAGSAGTGNGGTSGAGASGAGAGHGGSAGAGGSPPTLKKFVGNITTGGQVRSDFIQYWNQITPENEGKWGSVEATRNQMSWGGVDRVYNYAKQHNIPFKQHNFVWGAQQPSWLNGLSQSDQRAEVEEWIRLFCERYPDTQLIDVVNEPPPHTTPPYTAALGGAGSSGYDWIVQSFKWARQYCPNSILILNDYNTIEYANDNSHFIDIVNKIKAAGAPIDAIGAQAHAAHSMSTSTVQMYLDKLATSTGLPVYISEYDIDNGNDDQQKSIMQSQFTMFWNDDHVKGITLWGYIEGQTWQTNSGLMSSGGAQRPAMMWLMQFIGR